MLPPEVPVAIIGAGPSGLVAALLLERMGIETCVIERRASPQRAPAAHVVNARTFEICRAAGVDMQAIEQQAQGQTRKRPGQGTIRQGPGQQPKHGPTGGNAIKGQPARGQQGQRRDSQGRAHAEAMAMQTSHR